MKNLPPRMLTERASLDETRRQGRGSRFIRHDNAAGDGENALIAQTDLDMNANREIEKLPTLAAMPRSFSDLKSQQQVYFRRRARPWPDGGPLVAGLWPARNSPTDFIFIPRAMRGCDLAQFVLTTRLSSILGIRNCRRLGDLHGLRLSDLRHWRNCGIATMRELIQFIRDVQAGTVSTGAAGGGRGQFRFDATVRAAGGKNKTKS